MNYARFCGLIIALLITILLPRAVSSHGLAITYPIDSGNYRIEFEYQAAGQLVAGAANIYSVRLLDKKTLASVKFDTASVTLTNNNGIAFKSVMPESPAETGLAVFLATLAQGGDYTASVSINDGKTQIASGQTNFPVIDDTPTATSGPISGLRGWGIVVIAGFVGLLAGLLIPRMKK